MTISMRWMLLFSADHWDTALKMLNSLACLEVEKVISGWITCNAQATNLTSLSATSMDGESITVLTLKMLELSAMLMLKLTLNSLNSLTLRLKDHVSHTEELWPQL